MIKMTECPWCHRKAKKSMLSNYFPIYKCRKPGCGAKFCPENGPPCPNCGGRDYVKVGKVYA